MMIRFKRLHPDAKTPMRATKGDAGYDLAAIEGTLLRPGERKLIKTGLAMAIPFGYYGRVAPRSGLAVKKGLTTGAGVVDSGFRGEIGVLLFNHGLDSVDIGPGDRVAQLIIEACYPADWEEVESLDDTARGTGGYGSSGT